MTDHDLCTLFVAQVLVRIDPSRLVLGEESRILHFSDIVVQSSRTYELAFRTDADSCFCRKIGYLHGVLESSWYRLGHLAQ